MPSTASSAPASRIVARNAARSTGGGGTAAAPVVAAVRPSTAPNRSCALNGLATYPVMPRSRHRSRSPLRACAVSAMIGSVRPAGSARMASVAANPSISGIWMSMSTTSYVRAPTASTASRPLLTMSTWCPRFRSIAVATCWLTGLSSASRIPGGWRLRQHGTHRFDEIGPRNGFGEIGLDAQVPAALAIAALPRRSEDQELGSRQLGIGPNGAGQLEAVEVGHLGVQDGEVVRGPGLHAAAQRVQPRVGAWGFVHRDPFGTQHVPEDAPVGLVVIHHQQAPPAQGRRGAPGLCLGAAAAMGNERVKPNSLPRPTSLVTVSSPRISATSFREIARPSPVPP